MRQRHVSALVIALGGALVVGFALGALVGVGGGESASTSGTSDGQATSGYVFKNPVLRAKKGDWARFELYGGQQEMTQHVVGVDSRTHVVTIERVTTALPDGRLVNRGHHQYGPNHFLIGYGGIVQRMFPDEVVVAGRSFPCLCVEYRSVEGLVKTWYSSEVPCLGMLKQVIVSSAGRSRLNAELVDWSGRQPPDSK